MEYLVFQIVEIMPLIECATSGLTDDDGGK